MGEEREEAKVLNGDREGRIGDRFRSCTGQEKGMGGAAGASASASVSPGTFFFFLLKPVDFAGAPVKGRFRGL